MTLLERAAAFKAAYPQWPASWPWIVEEDGEQELFPAVGAQLTSRAADRIRAAGVIPLIPFRDKAAVRLGHLDSTADPPEPLAGRWR